MNYYLVKQTNKDGSKSFEKNDNHNTEDKLAQVDSFRKNILEKGIEIYEEDGCQFITSEGVLIIVSEDEISPIKP